MFYIVGLGNPGEKYQNTRHNVGFLILDHFVREAQFPSFHDSSAHSGAMTEGMLADKEVAVLKPSTYMNASGSAVKKFVPTNEIDRLVAVYDDIDLPFGEIRVSFGRGDGGHNGIKSIIEALGTKEFARMRIGIAHKSMWTGKLVRPKGEALAAYVLKSFTAKELKQLEEIAHTAGEALSVLIAKGKEEAMNQYN